MEKLLTIHQHSFGNIICIVSSDNLIGFHQHGTSIKCLPSKHTTECAIVSKSNFFDNLIHRPALIQFFVGYNFQRDSILNFIPFHGLSIGQTREYDAVTNGMKYCDILHLKNHPDIRKSLHRQTARTYPAHNHIFRSS